MKTHLFMVNGPEQRDSIIVRTLNRCCDSFDTIKIIQNGVSCDNPSIIDKYVIRKYNDFEQYSVCCQNLLDSIDIGDWFLYIDSDECPNKSLLEFFKNKDFCSDIYNCIDISFMHHGISDGEYTCHIDGGMYFKPVRAFLKTTSLHPHVYMKLHFGFESDNLIHTYFSEFRINHYKHNAAALLSTLAHYIYYPEAIGIPECYEQVQCIKDMIHEFLPSSVYQLFDKKDIWNRVLLKMKEMSFDTSHLDILKGMYNGVQLIINTSSLKNIYVCPKCEKECCNYD